VDTDCPHRSPFNDSLVASGSDDGKVRLRMPAMEMPVLMKSGIHLAGSRAFYDAD